MFDIQKIKIPVQIPLVDNQSQTKLVYTDMGPRRQVESHPTPSFDAQNGLFGTY